MSGYDDDNMSNNSGVSGPTWEQVNKQIQANILKNTRSRATPLKQEHSFLDTIIGLIEGATSESADKSKIPEPSVEKVKPKSPDNIFYVLKSTSVSSDLWVGYHTEGLKMSEADGYSTSQLRFAHMYKSIKSAIQDLEFQGIRGKWQVVKLDVNTSPVEESYFVNEKIAKLEAEIASLRSTLK